LGWKLHLLRFFFKFVLDIKYPGIGLYLLQRRMFKNRNGIAVMGTIRTEVSTSHLINYPNHQDLLTPFLDGFFVTWARKVKEYNTEIFVFFLSPEEHYKESYGFENEILLVYAPYPWMEPRTLQAVEQVLSKSPAKGRVEVLSYFLISDAENIVTWLDTYLSSRQESRIIIPLYSDEVIAARKSGNNWFIRNKLNQYYFGRDLFNNSLPLVEDAYFFGRQNILMRYFDAIKRSENRGIFGLRKTGKTSFLYKLKRLCESESSVTIFYYDCKVPHLRKSRWNELLSDIGSEIMEKFNILLEYPFSERTASKDFINIIKKVNDKGFKFCLMLDEIEYISFISPIDEHWKKDYLEFWQTIWSCQSNYKCLSIVIAGVNPSVVEKDTLDTLNGTQNPLFGIVTHEYLTGLTLDELKIMLKKLGRRMGLQFKYDACESICEWYGGHPLLTRLACSNLNSLMTPTKEKPIVIGKDEFMLYKEQIDAELIFYSEHAVSEIKKFYPDEYYLFELLATNQELDFRELISSSESYKEEIKHLYDYQLIKKLNKSYEINIPVIGKRVALGSKKLDDRELICPIIQENKRAGWLRRRVDSICSEMRTLEKIINKMNKIKLFGTNSFPEGDQFQKLEISNNSASFSSYINVLNRCFVESIERYGEESKNKNYFWEDIKKEYKYLWNALNKIKIYRHNSNHLHLNNKTDDCLNEYLSHDLEDKSFSQINDVYFVLQQRVLDQLLLAIIKEINILN
jgi:hypothetical protein